MAVAGASRTVSETKYQFWGNSWALAYYRMWAQREHIIRRVDTFNLADRTILSQAVTLDLDWDAVRMICPPARNEKFHFVGSWDEVSHSVVFACTPNLDRTGVQIPLISLRREQYLDVDCRDSSGKIMHLARRHENEQVAAHIVVGSCLDPQVPESHAFNLFWAAVKFVKDPNQTARDDLVAQAVAMPNASAEALISVLNDLQESFIQTLHLYPSTHRTEVLKFRVAAEPVPVSHLPKPSSADEASAPLEFAASSSSGTERDLPTLDEQVAPRRILEEYLGLRATRVELRHCAIGTGHHPVHTRFVAPAGTFIDDVNVFKGDQRRGFVDNNLKVKFHHERASILDKGVAIGEYGVSVKLNPKRGLFLLPAMAAMFLLACLLTVAILFGPNTLTHNDAGIVAPLLVVPSLAALFVVREAEHEALSKMFGAPRLLTVISAMLGVLSAALIAMLKGIGENSGADARPTSLYVLSLAWASTVVTLAFLGFQVVRISVLRRIVHTARMDPSRRGSLGSPKDKYQLFVVASVLVVWIIAAVLIAFFEEAQRVIFVAWNVA